MTEAMSPAPMHPSVQLLDDMSEATWSALNRNLAGLTEGEADWRPHPDANSIRWIIGHIAWFEVWAHDALAREGRFLVDTKPTALSSGSVAELLEVFAPSRERYRARIATLTEPDLARPIDFFGCEISTLELLKEHPLHLAGHRFQIRYIRGAYNRAHGTPKADFDPW